MADVYLISGGDRNKSVKELFRQFDTKKFRDSEVTVKANYNSADPPPGSTHIDTLRGSIEAIREAGGGIVTVVERSGMGTTPGVLEQRGVVRLAREMNFNLVTLEEMYPGDFTHFVRPWMHWRNGFYLVKRVTEEKPVVSLCCLKTHRFGGHFTLSLKNSVGLVAKTEPGGSYDFMRELHISKNQRLMIAEINAGYRPDIVILDATEGFSHGGPEQGELVHPGVIIGGNDRIAVDATGVALLRALGSTPQVMNGRIFGLEQIKRAAELGIGVSKPSEIRVHSLDSESKKLAAELSSLLAREG
ncbi:MAG TPA: DUF362 domain-containing protein [Methanoregulaceae archaeon]|nr:DUF362 domain-containing protein [Methanoregulaceae archaeon]